MNWKSLLFVLLSLLLLTACGSDPAPTPTPDMPLEPGDVTRGEALFLQPVIGVNNAVGCVTCHSLDPDTTLVGPSIAGIGSRAGITVPGQSAEEYLRLGIVDPDDYIVEGFQAGVMYQNYGDDLTEQEIRDLIAYMESLQDE